MLLGRRRQELQRAAWWKFSDAAFASRAFIFVNERKLLEPVRPATVIVNNTTNFNQTVNMANVRVVNRT